MSIKQEKTENKNELKLTITVDSQKFEDAILNVYNESKKYFNIPGFRKGKAPFKIVERYYGDEVFYQDAFNKLVPEVYEKELKDAKIEAVSNPKLDVVQMEKGKDLIFTAIISTKPEVKLGKYKGIDLKKVEYKVTDETINEEIKKMQDKNSRMVSIDNREAKKDDTVTIDFDGSVDGVPFEGGKSENYDLVIGSNSFIPGFEDQVIGMKLGEEKDIKVKFPKDYFEKKLADKDAIFKVKVNGIKEKQLPELDDEFAKDVSEFDTLVDLKKDIKSKKNKENEHRAKHEIEDNAIDIVCENTKINIPEGMIELEIDNMIENTNQRLQYQGISIDQYLKMIGKTLQDLRSELKNDAEKSVKRRLVLDQIIADEKITFDDKFIKEKLEEAAKQYNQKVEDLEKNEDFKHYLEETSKSQQAIDFIIKNANIK